MERYAQSETYHPTYQEGFASNATGVDVSILRCADGFWWDFVAGAFQDAYDANSLAAMTEDANGLLGLWNIEAGWAIPDADAHYQVRFKITDPTGAFYAIGPKIVVNSALLDELDPSVAGTLAYYASKLNINLNNKLLITETSGNAEQFDDAGVSQGTVAAAFTSVAGVTQRKRMVI